MSKIDYFYGKGHSQGHKVIDLGVIWKGFISWVYMPTMKSYGLKVMVKVIFARVTGRQDKN